MKIRLKKRARIEAGQAYRWYANVNPKSAAAFAEQVELTMKRMLEHPLAGAPYLANTRRLRIGGFPYWIVYRVAARSIVVYAVVHERRLPGYWVGTR